MTEKYKPATTVRNVASLQSSSDFAVNGLAVLFKMAASTFAVIGLTSCGAAIPGNTGIDRLGEDIRLGHERIMLAHYFDGRNFKDVCAISEGDQPASVLEGSGLDYPLSVTTEKNRKTDAFASFENGFVVFNSDEYLVFRQSTSEFCCIDISRTDCGRLSTAELDRVRGLPNVIYSLRFNEVD